jgi:hypothetical protein
MHPRIDHYGRIWFDSHNRASANREHARKLQDFGISSRHTKEV